VDSWRVGERRPYADLFLALNSRLSTLSSQLLPSPLPPSAQNLPEALEIKDAGEGFFLHDGAGEGGFVALEGADFFLNRATRQDAIRDDLIALADAVGAVDGLCLDSRIPPRIVEHHVARGGEIEAGTGGFQREQENRNGWIALETIDKGLTVFGLAGEHQMGNVALHEFLADELEHRDKLRENQNLVAFRDEWFERFEQRVELGARRFLAGSLAAADKARIAADLAEAEERLEDVETLGVEFAGAMHAEENLAGAFELGVVEDALRSFEFAHDFFFDTGRQIAGDLGFRAAQQEVAHAGSETGARAFWIGAVVVEALEVALAAEQPGHREGEKTPKVEQPVFYGRAGEHEAVRGAKSAGGVGGGAAGIFNVLTFVENHDIPVTGGQSIRVETELGVVGDHEMCARTGSGRVKRAQAERDRMQRGRETGGFERPVCRHGFRANDERAKRFRGIAAGEPHEPDESLDGFAETHVVGEHAAETVIGKPGEKFKTFALIRSQRGGDGFR